jgi:LPS-assembly protein
VASYNWTGEPDAYGGRLRLMGSMLDLVHHTGPEVRRASLQPGWSLPFNGALGDRFTFDASLRTDAYDSDHVPLTPNAVTLTDAAGTVVQLPSNIGTTNAIAGRAFPVASLKWRYPWVRTDRDGSALVEPIVAAIASPRGENPARIPNEDSQGFEFDEMSLFVPNRLPGYDRVDSGQRVDYGVHGELHSQAYGSWETLIGQSYAFKPNDFFQPGSGLNTRISDIVGRVVASPAESLDFIYRFRLDEGDFAVRRQEAEVKAGPASLRASLSFIQIAAIPGTSTVAQGDQISASLEALLTRYWSVSLRDTRSIGGSGTTINSGVALTYRDDCFEVVGSVTQSGISVGDVRPGVSVLLTVVFKNLGEVGERVLSTSGT